MNATINDTARAWVGCLSCYNDGNLVGEWCDAAEAVEWKCPNPVTIYNFHEELWCFDMEGVPSALSREMAPWAFAEMVESLSGVSDSDAYGAFIAYRGGVEYASPEQFEEAYQGEWGSEEDFAMQLAEDLGCVNDDATWPNNYIDWERAARDLFMDGYTFIDGYVFNDNC